MTQFTKISQLDEYKLNDSQTIFLKNCNNVIIENVNGKYVISIENNQDQNQVKKSVKVKAEKKVKVYSMSTQLCEFFEVPYDTYMSRGAMIKKINKYIFTNKLNNKSIINLNETLKTLFGLVDENEIKIYQVSKYIKNHVISEYKEKSEST